jgi:excisionase family DNA binding protein
MKILYNRLGVIEDSVLEIRELLEELRQKRAGQQTEKWLTRDQVRAQFKISFPTINKLEKQGVIKGYRMGKRVLFLRSEIEQQLKGRAKR